MARNIEELKKRLGFAGPWSNRLAEAVTHRSYAVENNLGYDNQRLEFLGDAVLEIILTEYLFHLYPDVPRWSANPPSRGSPAASSWANIC